MLVTLGDEKPFTTGHWCQSECRRGISFVLRCGCEALGFKAPLFPSALDAGIPESLWSGAAVERIL